MAIANDETWTFHVTAAVAQKEIFVTSRRTRRNDWITCKFEIVFFCFIAETNKQKRDRRASNLYNEGRWYSTT